MPPWQAALGDAGVTAVADYARARVRQRARRRRRRELYRTYCVACHQPDGAGLAALGAPPLTDAEWVYGGSLDDIRTSIALGRNGRMPALPSASTKRSEAADGLARRGRGATARAIAARRAHRMDD